MSAATSAEALHARLESEVSRAVADVDQVVMLGLPTAIETLPGNRDSIMTASKTVVELAEKGVGADAIIKRLLPLAAAYTELSGLLRSLATANTTPTLSTVVAVSHASGFLFHYTQIINAVVQGAPVNQVPLATLLKVLEPFSQIKLLMPLLKRAYKYAQKCPHTPETPQFENEAVIFQGSLCNMFVILTNTAKILLLSPLVLANLTKIREAGASYAKEDTLWSWMDKCTEYLANHDAHVCLGAKHGEPFLRFASATCMLLNLNPMAIKKRKFAVFYNKDYDECYLKAFEYFAEDGGNNIVFGKESYHHFADDINHGLIVFIHSPNHEENYTAGSYESLTFSGSIAVQERIYNACLKIFNTTLKFQKEISDTSQDYEKLLKEKPIIPFNMSLVVNGLSLFGLKRFLFGRNDQDTTPLSISEMIRFSTSVAQGDILRANAWLSLHQMRLYFSDRYFPYSNFAHATNWIAIYNQMAGRYISYPMCFHCGEYLSPSENGEYTTLKLHFEVVSKLCSIVTVLPECTSQLVRYPYCNPNNILATSLELIQKIMRALFGQGIFSMPVGDPRYEIIWNYYKDTALSILKAIKALITVPMDKWEHLKHGAGMATEKDREHVITDFIGACVSQLSAIVTYKTRLQGTVPASFTEDCAALAMVILDCMASATNEILENSKFFLYSIENLVGIVLLSRSILKDALSSGDKGLARLFNSGLKLVKLMNETDHHSEEANRFRKDFKELTSFVDELKSIETGTGVCSSAEEEDRNIFRAVERAKILSVLPCSCPSCLTVCHGDEKKIPAKLCSACKAVKYCSSRCQKKDWKVHKVACKALAAVGKS